MSAAPLWTIAEVARALGLAGEYPDTPIDFVTQDSRLVKPGCLFVALSGTPSGGFISSFASARDGWEFADKAQAAGAVAMIVPHHIEGVSVPQLVVKDTLIDGLWRLARAAPRALRWPGDRPDRQRRQDQHQGIPRRLSGRLCEPQQFQQFLGRAADAVQCQPRRERVGRRNGHEPDGRNRAAERTDEADRGAGGQRAAGASGKARQPGSDPPRESKHRARACRRTACWCCRRMSRRRNGTARSSASARDPRCGS